jgi:methylmalonyl-CoA epimerase
MARRSAPISRRGAAAGAWRHHRVRDAAQHQDRVHPAARRGLADRQIRRAQSDGGIHHICYDVPDIIAARDTLIKEGARVLGDGVPKIGAHGKPVLFLHPKDFSGALVEIEQA